LPASPSGRFGLAVPASRPLALKGNDLTVVVVVVVVGAGVHSRVVPVVLDTGVVSLCADDVVGKPKWSSDPHAGARTMTIATVRTVRRMFIAEESSNPQAANSSLG
jgi:hypothetical protein